MKRGISSKLLLLFLLALSAKISYGNINGKVTNQASKGIANAVCSLLVKGIKTTTNADGSYLLSTTGVMGIPIFNSQIASVTLEGDMLKFSIPSSNSVRVEFFNGKGELLKKYVFNNAQRGFYSFNISEHFKGAKLIVIRTAIGNEVAIFRYIPLTKAQNMRSIKGMSDVTSSSLKLAKIAAVIDTLKVSAPNYLSKKVAVTTYDTTINIVLDTIPENGVIVQLDQERQTIDGFGINNNWKPLGQSGINACFDSVSGLGLSILRIGMYSDGNLFSSNNWDDVKNAVAKGCKYIIGSTWSPPGNWKDNGKENDGGHLLQQYYSQWADRIVAFASKVKQNAGVDLYAMSIGNEPDFASCGMNEPCNGNYPTTLYTAEEMVAFIKVVGPKMRASAPNCKIMAPEASEWIHTWSDTSGCCSVPGGKPSSDPLKCGCFQGKTTPCSCAPGKGYSYGKYLYEDKTAWSYVDILGVHQYDTQRAEPWPDYVAVKDRKPVW